MRNQVRDESFADSIRRVAEHYPGIHMDLTKADMQDDENPQRKKALRDAARKVAMQKGANALNKVMGRRGSREKFSPEDIEDDTPSAANGRFGDTELIHANKAERNLLEMLGGAGTRNPIDGKKEYWYSDGGDGTGDYGYGGDATDDGGTADYNDTGTTADWSAAWGSSVGAGLGSGADLSGGYGTEGGEPGGGVMRGGDVVMGGKDLTAPVQGFPRAKISVAPFRAAPGPKTVGIAGKSPEDEETPGGRITDAGDIPVGKDGLEAWSPDALFNDDGTFVGSLTSLEGQLHGLDPRKYEGIPMEKAINLARNNIAPGMFGVVGNAHTEADNVLDTLGIGAGVAHDRLEAYRSMDPLAPAIGTERSYTSPLSSLLKGRAPDNNQLAEMAITSMGGWPSTVGAGFNALASLGGLDVTSIAENEADQGLHGISVADGSLADSLGLSDYYASVSPEDATGFDAGGEMDELNVPNGPSGPPQVAAPAPVVENPAGLNLTGTPGQQLAQMSTFAVAGGAGQGPSRSEGGQDFFKQLVRQVYGSGGELAGEANIRPIDLQYAREVLGLSEDGEREAFLRAIG